MNITFLLINVFILMSQSYIMRLANTINFNFNKLQYTALNHRIFIDFKAYLN